MSKFTQNSIQAVEDCEKLAYEYGHQEITVEHFFMHCSIWRTA
jgi:ATP-dependent Clp protease ATP-binding subunit ClpB